MNDRRQFVCLLGSLAAAQLLPTLASAQSDVFAPLIAGFTGGAPVTHGRVTLDIPPLAENGNAVPLRIGVDSPMSAADHVDRIIVLSEKNPRPVVATFHLGPRVGRALIATRVRLNGTQRVMAIARLSDGTFWSGLADVVVTSTACWDES
jgi:sulfur-oxidizing protein SoxY